MTRQMTMCEIARERCFLYVNFDYYLMTNVFVAHPKIKVRDCNI